MRLSAPGQLQSWKDFYEASERREKGEEIEGTRSLPFLLALTSQADLICPTQ